MKNRLLILAGSMLAATVALAQWLPVLSPRAGPPRYVQGIAAYFTGDPDATTTAGIATNKGNFFVVWATGLGGKPTISSSGSTSTWTEYPTATLNRAMYGPYDIWWTCWGARNLSDTASHTFTATRTGSGGSILVMEIAGVNVVSAGGTGAQANDTATAYTVDLTTDTRNCLIVSGIISDIISAGPHTDSSATAGPTVNAVGVWDCSSSYKTVGVTGTYTSSWTCSAIVSGTLITTIALKP